MNRDEFCTRLMAGHLEQYPTSQAQTLESCLGIYDLYMQVAPDCAIEVGTRSGLSTMIGALALTHLGHGHLTTIDCDHDSWRVALQNHAALLVESGVDPQRIALITEDFVKVSARDVLPQQERVFLFYDVHDRADNHPTPVLLEEWMPWIQSGVVAIHDCVLASYVGQLPHTIRHHDGRLFACGLEGVLAIQWLNTHRGAVHVSPAKAIYFEVENGRPCADH